MEISRIKIFRTLFLFFFLLIVIRLFYLQIIKHKYFYELSCEQRIRVEDILPKRGNIYDRNGNLLATSLQRWSIYVRPKSIENDKKKQIEDFLIKNFPTNSELIKKKFVLNQGFWLVRKADKNVVSLINSLECNAIDVILEPKRVYPKNELACQLIGFVGVDNKGLSGIELTFEEDLFGKVGKQIVERDPFGRQIYSSNAKILIPPSDGKNIYLTIDEAIQYVAQKELKKAVIDSKAISGMIIVMDVKNGDILAISSYPDFNPNDFLKTDPKFWKLSPVTDIYEPGSTFKVITAAAGIEEKIVDIDSVIPCPNEIKIGGIIVRNSHPVRMYGKAFKTLRDVIAESINTGTSYISIKLGKNKFYDYIKKFGFGEITGIDFIGEQSGILFSPQRWHESDVATISFGQTIAVTPIQLICAVTAIANDGVRIKPRLIKKVESEDEMIIRYYPEKVLGRAISKETAEKVKILMKDAVYTDHATGKKAKIPFFLVAAKTGTAQKVVPKIGYVAGKYIASIVGFTPASNPKIAILVIVNEPKTTIWGATVAAPVFKNVGEFALRALSVAPDM